MAMVQSILLEIRIWGSTGKDTTKNTQEEALHRNEFPPQGQFKNASTTKNELATLGGI
eukprot:CAMPEP_0185791516 /NCGR_PEP_ID=MMETSP1174-20130828/158417_1 /TAXON_ID=35687 /ORGANISM="Dictyocha speculum, Strain CCMP1381" /LENGTH=57 /DNA_ID=CAMNT_0028486473 /DNA_START=1633 /DNA_END=1806 /DNA_ORIENTATION=-